MLRSIELQNFKCFGEPARIPIAPITLIFGQNSAGKSSILQALYLLMQTRRCGDPKVPLLFRAENGLTDLGSFEEAVYDHDYENRCISIRLDVDFRCPHNADPQSKEWFKSVDAQTMGLKLEFLRQADDGEVSLHGFELYIDDDSEPLARFERSAAACADDKPKGSAHKAASGSFNCVHLSRNSRYWTPYFERKAKTCLEIEQFINSLDEEVRQGLEHRCQELLEQIKQATTVDAFVQSWWSFWPIIPFLVSTSEYFLPGRVCSARNAWESYGDETRDRLLNEKAEARLYENETYPDQHVYHEREILPLVPPLNPANLSLACAYNVHKAISGLLALGPLRARPERFYMFSGSTPQGVGFYGERAAEVLFRNPDLQEEVNSWLDQLDMGYAVEVGRLDAKYASMFELRLRDTVRGGNCTVALSDVGFGVGQVLPLIVQCLITESQTILVEQPEIHIHPALQARLGKFFAESAKRKNNTFIVETHSEHLILRLQRLIRQGNLRPEDVSIICVSRGSNGSTTRQMRLDDKGEFLDDWPGGFFTERLRELLD